MVILGRVERTRCCYFGYHRVTEGFRRLYLFQRLFGRAFLILVMVENAGAILAAAVTKLAISRGWINVYPEHLEQLFVTDLGWIEFD